jgi:hypothetical protein
MAKPTPTLIAGLAYIFCFFFTPAFATPAPVPSQRTRSEVSKNPPNFKVNSPVRIKNASLQVLAGEKEPNTSVFVNNREVIPLNPYKTWYYEYPVNTEGSQVTITMAFASQKQIAKTSIDLNKDALTLSAGPVITGYGFDRQNNNDFILTIKDPPKALSYNIYYANSLTLTPGTSPFILAQANYRVSGTGITLWRDNGSFTGIHPADPQIKMRFYKLEIAGLNPAVQLAISSATASSYIPMYPANMAIDGSLATYWASTPGQYSWIKFDLGKPYNLTRISLFWNRALGAANYDIQGSLNGANWDTLYARLSSIGGFNNPVQKDYDLSGSYRYIRVYINTPQQPARQVIYEVRLYGYPAPDITPPTTPQVTDDGATTVSATQLHARWTSSDPESGISEYAYKITVDSVSGPAIIDWVSAGTAQEITRNGLSLIVDKTYYFAVKAKNGAGIWSDVGYSDGIRIIVLDNTPPTGSIKINNDEQYTSSAAVTLTLSAEDNPGGSGVSHMRFSNNNVNWPTTPDIYATTKPWTLAAGNGTKTVYVMFKDAADNWSQSISDTIILDTTGPKIINVSPANGSTFSEGSAILISPVVNDNNLAPVEYQFSVNNEIKQGWSSQINYSWDAVPGRHILKVEAKDIAGQDVKEIEVYVFRKPIEPPA